MNIEYIENENQITDALVVSDPLNRIEAELWKVGQANELINAQYKMEYTEMAVLLMAISKIDYRKDAPDTVSFHINDFVDVFGVNPKSVYRQVKNAVNNLFNRSLSVQYERDGKQFNGRFRWLYAEASCSDGTVSLSFSPKILPLLGNLKSKYTNIELIAYGKLNSFYSLRLFSLLVSGYNATKVNRDMFEFAYTLDDLRKKLEAEDKYARWIDFAKYVIKPAIKDINENSEYLVEYTPKKKGRAFNRIIFRIMKKDI